MQRTELVELGNRILMAREEKKMSQEQLSAAVGCSQSALSNYEKGKRRIYLSQLEKIAEALERPLDYFLDNLEQQSVDHMPAAPDGQSHPPISPLIMQIINHIYLLDSEQDINDLDQYIRFLLWKKNQP